MGTGLVALVTAVAFLAGTLVGQVPASSPTPSPAALAADVSPSNSPVTATTPSVSATGPLASPTDPPTSEPSATPRPARGGGATATNVKVVKSANWAGYGLLKGQFTDVSAEWTEPEVDCSVAGANSYVSFWVGLDGVTSNSVEQIGTAADCITANGPARHYAWYELYPTPEKETPLVEVHPGDHLVATVHGVTTRAFQMTLTNTTTGQTFSSLQGRLGDWPTSAEWVVEPTAICRQSCVTSKLAQFSDVTFTNVSAGTLDGPVALGDATDLYRFDIRAKHGGKVAAVSPLALDEPSFGVHWLGK